MESSLCVCYSAAFSDMHVLDEQNQVYLDIKMNGIPPSHTRNRTGVGSSEIYFTSLLMNL